MLNLIINGDVVKVPEHIRNVSDLLQHFELDQKVSVVEHNQDILKKKDHAGAAIRENDRFEIVHFVGGG